MDSEAILVSTVKGIEVETGMLMHQVFEEALGPSFHARLVFCRALLREGGAARKPTAVTLACAQRLRDLRQRASRAPGSAATRTTTWWASSSAARSRT
jgi:glycerol-3-phosphate dehydrogenase